LKARTKYRKGPLVGTEMSAILAILDGRWLYLHDKPKSPKVLVNMNLATIRSLVAGRALWFAVENRGPR
jgi:hypothetical protein